MAELTFKSPGVSTREIDLSGPTTLQPRGVPAGVIGTSQKGIAFVPITFATYADFKAEFGGSDGEMFAPLAVNEWMKHAGAGTFVRILGIGDGKARTTSGNNAGKVTNAGYVVGDRLVQANGVIGDNEFAGSLATAGTGILGRTYVLGCFMSQSSNSNLFSDANIQTNVAQPIIRGILMAPSGVNLALRSSKGANNEPAANSAAFGSFGATGAGDAGTHVGGDVDLTAEKGAEFVLLINGLKKNSSYPQIISASFEPQSSEHYRTKFNTDPTKIQEAGHYLYTSWDVEPAYGVVTGSGVITAATYTNNLEPVAFLLTGALARNTGGSSSATAAGIPNLECWEDRFRTAFSPHVISQKFGGKNVNLFKFHALDDGAHPSSKYKITIENIFASPNENYKFGTFDVLVRSNTDTDRDPVVLESFRGLSLDPASDRFIGKIIGDTNMYYDFDKKAGGQKLVIDGAYPNKSSYIRVECTSDLRNGRVDDVALPVGFRGLHHLVSSGSANTADAMLTGSLGNGITTAEAGAITKEELRRTVTPPVPFRTTLSEKTGQDKIVNTSLTWGVQYEFNDNINEPNLNNTAIRAGGHEGGIIDAFTTYFPRFSTSWQKWSVGDNEGTPDKGDTVLDADRFNNNIFTLERVEVIKNASDKPDDNEWAVAHYRRNGSALGTMTNTAEDSDAKDSRFLDVTKDFGQTKVRPYLKFTFPLQGGFDGVNIFDEDKAKFLDAACRREMDDSTLQGGTSGPTVAAFRKAVDVMEEKSDVDIQLLAIPGIRHESVTDYAIESTERRFDALYIMDVEEKEKYDSFITGSNDKVVNVTNTVNRFAGRNLDSSFAAAYFPDVNIYDTENNTSVICPPSVAVLGAFALNDSLAHPWYAPAGFTRGAMSSVQYSMVNLNRTNLDELYTVDINPLTSFPHTRGVVVFGQKTLLAAQSALDRVNVRRLLINIRRKVKRIANSLLFEPNREDTLNKFSAAVTPILTTIQQQQGLDRFKVQIDTSTTTQADVENNTIRGKIFLQPTRAVEFISLDFVVTNAGADV